MTLAYTTAPLAARSPARPLGWAVSGWDVLAVASLTALWAAVVFAGWASLPMQLWDESRNANNALEMALNGHWLTPSYGGAVDHWNTKPPLMIWAMAGLLRLGVAPLLALRAPAMLAALATVLLIWGVLRGVLKDRLAALAAGVLLLGCTVYIGPHGARTADYDAPESAFILGYALSIWAAFDSGRTRWLFAAAACIGLGVLTKGVAALLPLPGLVLFALLQPRRLGGLLKDWRSWAAAALCVALVAGYYLSRETYDPGYLAAIGGNELGGRFLKVTENHHGSWHFYLRVLLQQAEPGAVIAGLGLIPLAGAEPRRRALALACGLSALSLLLVLSSARSKMEWYAVPLTPLLCLIAGLGLSEAVRRAGSAGVMRPRAQILRAAAAAALAGAALFSLGWATGLPGRQAAEPGSAQRGYGGFLEQIRRSGLAHDVVVLDTGFRNDAGFADYDPMLKFYADLETARGLAVTVVHADAGLDAGRLAASCDPRMLQALQDDYRSKTLLARGGCRLLRVAGDAEPDA